MSDFHLIADCFAGCSLAIGFVLLLKERAEEKARKFADQMRANRSQADDEWREWARRQNAPE